MPSVLDTRSASREMRPVCAFLLLISAVLQGGCSDEPTRSRAILPAPSDASGLEAVVSSSSPGLPEVTNLGVLPGGSNSVAYGINDRGEVVGSSDDASGRMYAFLWTERDGMRSLGTLPGDNRSSAAAISDSGDVVGWSAADNGPSRPFIWSAGLGMRELDAPSGTTLSAATSINGRGDVVGWASLAGGAYHALLWSKSGGRRDLGTLPGGVAAQAFGINDLDEAVGTAYLAPNPDDFGTEEGRAMRWTASSGMQDLGNFPGANKEAYGINKGGQIVGVGRTQEHGVDFGVAFLWRPTSGYARLDPPGFQSGDFPDGQFAAAQAINDSGQVVGWSSRPSDSTRAFSWTAGGGFLMLGPVPGDVDTRAYAINNTGQIAGASGVHAALWTLPSASGGFAAAGTAGTASCDIRLSDGQAYCWGHGALGQSTALSHSNTAVAVTQSGIRFVSLAVNASTVCALDDAGHAYCWGEYVGRGWNAAGRVTSATPVPIASERRFTSLSAGTNVTCGVETGTGDLYCWGYSPSFPSRFSKGMAFVSFSAGTGCGLLASGQAVCGQLGSTLHFTLTSWRRVPQQRFRLVEGACGITQTGDQLYCWDPAGDLIPVHVPGSQRWARVSYGLGYYTAPSAYVCGVTINGAGYCWGRNQLGQLGNGH